MNRLFVDVDDTLILWPKEPKGAVYDITVDVPVANPAVIEFVRRWVGVNRHGEVIVWSSGGLKYAQEWRHKLLPFASAWCKEPYPMQSDDMFIDDDPMWFYKGRNIHPDMLIGIAP